MFAFTQKVQQYSPIFMNGKSLQNKESLDLVGVAFEHDLRWHRHITSIATSAAKKHGFHFRARSYFSSLTLYLYYLRIPNKALSEILFSRLGSGTTVDITYTRFHSEESHPTY